MGFGLVVGLKHTGDSMQTGFTKQALTNLLDKMGLSPQEMDFKSRNVASVMVTANIQPFIKPGQKLDVTISSVGDASSLKGGTLLQTPLMGADNIVYAVAQGQVLVGADGGDFYPSAKVNQDTVGRLPNGAIVENEIPVTIDDKKLTVVLDRPDFTTASRLAQSIAKIGYDAKAIDAATVIVPIFKGEDPVDIIAKVEGTTVVPDVIAKVVINERTGMVVIGENVRMAPVAVAYKGFSVSIGSIDLSSTSGEKEGITGSDTSSKVSAKVESGGPALKMIPSSATVSDLVKALNSLGASPKDLISILQSIKEAGALPAEIEVIS
jgi:flagellar P-ring protein precursor FlgI